MGSQTATRESVFGCTDREIVRLLFDRVYSKGELSLVDDVVSSDVVGSSTEATETFLGPEGIKAHVRRLRTVFYGFDIEIEELSLEGGTFTVSWRARGTQERHFLGIEPTCSIGAAGEEPHGARIDVRGVARGAIRRGSIQGLEMEWDGKQLRRQLCGSVEAPDVEPESPNTVAGPTPPANWQ